MDYKNEVIWGMRNPNEDKHWKKLNLDKYNPNKPIVVCIGGNGTTTESFANGIAKVVEIYLQLLFNKGGKNCVYDYIDIISAVYPINDDSDKGAFEKEDIDDFVDNFLIKIIQDENDELVPLNEACRRLSQVTFFTYCRGHHEVDKIMHAFYKELKVLGYTRQERDILMMSFFEVTFAPATYSSLIPIMFVDSKQDEMINYAWKNGETSACLDNNLNGIAVKYERYGDVLLSGIALSEAIYDAIHIYSSSFRNGNKGDEHNLAILARDIDWSSLYETNADCVSQMIAWIICRAVENSLDNFYSDKYVPQMSLEELIGELFMIMNDFTPEQLMIKEKE